MALRNQPYLPLYVQDFMTDERLIECSAASTGVYIRVMCILHKQEPYGKLLLKQKYKQTEEQISNFAKQLVTSLPYDFDQIKLALHELLSENVLQMDGDILYQKRMVKDNELSEKRAEAGSRGGKKTTRIFAKAKSKAKGKAKPEYEDENEIEDISKNTGKNKIPTIKEVRDFFSENGYNEEIGEKAWNYYNDAKWHDAKGNKVKNWKQKMRGVWFKDENKAVVKKKLYTELNPEENEWQN